MTISPDFAAALAHGATEIAAEASGNPARTENLGYGVDLECFDDLTDTMSELAAYPEDPAACRQFLAQYLYHMLDTPKGALIDDRDWGLGVCRLLNVGITTAGLAEIAGRVKDELQKCDYVDTVQPTVAVTDAGRMLRLRLRVVPVDPSIGVFTMVVAATTTGAVLEAIEGG